jgi:hypothetical protein
MTLDREVAGLIDKALTLCAGKQIVAASEMMDILLDIRILLSADAIEELTKQEEPV